MDYLVSEEEAANDMEFCPFPKSTDEDHLVERSNVSQLTLPSPSRAPVVEPQATQKSFNSRLAQRQAQRNFRQRQKEQRMREQARIEEQSRELEKEQHTRKGLEEQVQQLKAEIVQLNFSAERWKENSTVLQGSVKALQKSLDLLHRGSTALCHDANQPRARSKTPLSPSSSQPSPGNHVPPRNLSHLPKFLGKAKLRPMISPISPMLVTQKGARLPLAPPRP
ncbi:hypothetical protein N7508_011158 [Penicillium antarcticum]|uniref:uncharacterized protein n=1 Tax=Penicillium antarcticum TaxID=416450 RepID=UPI0023A2531A|nr:uncharacterized protein N7508_011158 [Penicillium antarcticum]KAJ5288383.1 hypothetical protein N7508_011158 [Penicillium antarcticum]